jgi:cell division inhibitor SepF
MKISKPTNFDQVDEVINELKDKNAVVINLEYVSKDVARRIVDVIGGAVKALDGHIEKVSNSIFVVAPINYDIMNEATKEKIERKYSAPLMK